MSMTGKALIRHPLFIAALITAVAATPGLAAGPFGVGLPEPAPSGGGFFPGLFHQIAEWQSGFYRDLTATIRALKSDGTAGIWLATVSFVYGVLHAAGPGHGKAIVTSYVLANGETAKNGAVLAMVSAAAQAITAVALVSIAGILLGATSIAMNAAAEWFEIGSFALVTGLGAWLVWRKIIKPMSAALEARYAPVPVGAHHHDDHAHHGHAHHDHGHHDHGHGDGHEDCGHVPDIKLAEGPLNWTKAWSTVAAVGLRPCTGALIVLVFSLSQGLYIAGIGAAFAMALGTGLTVAVLTLATVSARGLAMRLSGGSGSRLGQDIHMAVEGVGALLVLAFGLIMLGASLSG